MTSTTTIGVRTSRRTRSAAYSAEDVRKFEYGRALMIGVMSVMLATSALMAAGAVAIADLPLWPRVIRFALTAVLFALVYRGSTLARGLMVALCIAGTGLSLRSVGGADTISTIGIAALGVFSLAVAALLVVPSPLTYFLRVQRE